MACNQLEQVPWWLHVARARPVWHSRSQLTHRRNLRMPPLAGCEQAPARPAHHRLAGRCAWAALVMCIMLNPAQPAPDPAVLLVHASPGMPPGMQLAHLSKTLPFAWHLVGVGMMLCMSEPYL